MQELQWGVPRTSRCKRSMASRRFLKGRLYSLFAPPSPLVCVLNKCGAHGCCCHLFCAKQRLQQQQRGAGSDEPTAQSPTGGFLAAFCGEREVVALPPEKSDKMLALELTEQLRRKVEIVYVSFKTSFLTQRFFSILLRGGTCEAHCLPFPPSQQSNLPQIDLATRF